MAADEPNQKRKRGRPAVASKNADNASERESKKAVDEGSSSTTRRRGRSQKNNESAAELEAAPTENQGIPDAAPKKRGRPGRNNPDAETGEDGSAQKQSDETTQSADMIPKKRGRRPRNQDSEPEEVEPTGKQPSENAPSPAIAPKKRGRSTRNQDTELEAESAETRPRKRARGNVETETDKSQEVEQALRPKLGKKKVAQKEPDLSQSQDATEGQTRPKRRGRAANLEESSEEAQTEASRQGETSRKKAGRPAKQPEPAPEEPSSRGRVRSGRQAADKNTSPATRARNPPRTSPDESQTEAQPKKSQRGRRSLAEVPVSKAQNRSIPPPEDDTATSTTQPKKKRGPSRPSLETTTTANSPSNPPPQPKDHPPPYLALTTLTRSIPRSTISSKWSPLPPQSISQIQSLISVSARPVLLRLKETPRQQQASTILRTFSNRLNTKLIKGMPFPQTLDEQLDFEKTLDTIQALEKQLDPLLHSVALLKSEKEKEEEKLEADYKALKELEGNARAQRSGWRERMGRNRKHGLVPERDQDGDEKKEEVNWLKEGGVEIMKRDNSTRIALGGTIFRGDRVEDEEDEDQEVEMLAKQIASHMESMKGNLSQIDGLVEGISKGKGALQGVLGKYLSEEAYESIVLG
ncbi:CENP-Q, a CENPA-CAD centromere complex subunit-domain-containing protein [Podospora fimiseda]|uniref:CENP-Q, a CENPA-CAD centromere complex subunit-domain-containing protein n=1 Tax=Podospora fimiseda TaxID=252190 RepID=A0AAN7BRF4_9PEZI|nr:CENP-Q, a CENPA-CAD centromere complex subunit-domain-containing protein [Podospora fimiseda]